MSKDEKAAEETAAQAAPEEAAGKQAAEDGKADGKQASSAKSSKKKKKKENSFFKKHAKIIKRIVIIALIAIVAIAVIAYIAYKIPVMDQRSGDPSEYDIAEAGEWTDGVYTEQVDGKNRFSVTVTIEGGYITEVDTSDNDETPSRGGKALPELAQETIDNQTADVEDVMTGVTLTTDAYKDAVFRCLEDASK